MKNRYVIFLGYRSTNDIPTNPLHRLEVGKKYKVIKEENSNKEVIVSLNKRKHKTPEQVLFFSEYKWHYEIKNDFDWLDKIQHNFRNGV